MTWQTTLGTAMLAASLLPGNAAGQDVASSWEQLQGAGGLERGDGVHVTDSTGRRIRGAITDLSSTGLTITRGRETWTLTAPEIVKVERQDPIWHGAVIGAAIGYGALFGFCLRGDFSDCFAVGAYAPRFVAAAAALGLVWDASAHKTLYEAPGDSQVAVAPLLEQERIGARVSLTW